MRRGQSRGQQLEPIARWEPTPDGDVLLMDTRALMIHLGIGDRTVRRYREYEVKRDAATGTPLYDALAIGEARQKIPNRACCPPKVKTSDTLVPGTRAA